MIDRLGNIRYLLSRKEDFQKGEVMPLEQFKVMGWHTDNFGAYDIPYEIDQNIIAKTVAIPYREQHYNEVVPAWVKEERRKKLGSDIPYYFYATGIQSRELIRPPFLIHSTQNFNYSFGVIQSVWLHNDLHYEPVTREFDLFENNAEHGLWFAYHYSDEKNYKNRKIHNTPLCFRPKGINTVIFELLPSVATWWLNGKKVKKISGDFMWNYFVLLSLIPTVPNAEIVNATPHKITILK